jgi:hypothetical protein
MRFAESARTRCALVLSTLLTGYLAIAAWPKAAARAEAPRPPVHKMHGCGAKAHVAPPPVQAEDPYVATLRSVREPLTACLGGDHAVDVRLAINIAPDGSVKSMEARTISNDLSKVDLHVVKCLDSVVQPLVFPEAPSERRISTFVTAR